MYDIRNKRISCKTWEHMLELSKIANEQGYKPWKFNKSEFPTHPCFLAWDFMGEKEYTNGMPPKANDGEYTNITYSDFKASTPPQETVNGC